MNDRPVRAAFAVPGDIGAMTGGYVYARRMLEHVPAHGVHLVHLPLPGSFPHPSEADLAATLRVVAAAPERAPLLVDGLAYGALPPELIRAAGRRMVALVHHPLAYETGLDDAARKRLLAGERGALALARQVVVTSPTTARTLVAEFDVPPERVSVAEPGTERRPRARGSAAGPLKLLAVGAVIERKAYPLLVEALAGLAALPWRLDIVGSLARDVAAVADLRHRIAAAALSDRVRLCGELPDPDLAAAYDSADLFVSASRYEGYGMALAEAMARGLPIVTTTEGAAGETVPDGAALKVPAGDPVALARALHLVLTDVGLRARLRCASYAAVDALPSWTETAARLAAVLLRAAYSSD